MHVQIFQNLQALYCGDPNPTEDNSKAGGGLGAMRFMSG